VRNGNGESGPPDGAVLRGLKVLVAEDEAIIALDLAITLRELGCEVLPPVPSVARALALLAAERPDAALLDLRLTDGPATPVAQALAAAGVPFAVTSGLEAGQLGKEPALRAAPYLAKPYGYAGLRATLARLAASTPASTS
jgi:CheY-like chemotaxis protein